jgi:hypothetical protein
MFSSRKRGEAPEGSGDVHHITLQVDAKLHVRRPEDLTIPCCANSGECAPGKHDFYCVSLFDVIEDIRLQAKVPELDAVYISAIELRPDLVTGGTLHSDYVIVANPVLGATQTNALLGKIHELAEDAPDVSTCFAFLASPDHSKIPRGLAAPSCTRLQLAVPSAREMQLMRDTAKYHRTPPDTWYDPTEIEIDGLVMHTVPKVTAVHGKPTSLENPLHTFFTKNYEGIMSPMPLEVDDQTLPRAAAGELAHGDTYVASARLIRECISFLEKTKQVPFCTTPFLAIIPLAPHRKFVPREETLSLTFRFEYVTVVAAMPRVIPPNPQVGDPKKPFSFGLHVLVSLAKKEGGMHGGRVELDGHKIEMCLREGLRLRSDCIIDPTGLRFVQELSSANNDEGHRRSFKIDVTCESFGKPGHVSSKGPEDRHKWSLGTGLGTKSPPCDPENVEVAFVVDPKKVQNSQYSLKYKSGMWRENQNGTWTVQHKVEGALNPLFSFIETHRESMSPDYKGDRVDGLPICAEGMTFVRDMYIILPDYVGKGCVDFIKASIPMAIIPSLDIAVQTRAMGSLEEDMDGMLVRLVFELRGFTTAPAAP